MPTPKEPDESLGVRRRSGSTATRRRTPVRAAAARGRLH